MTRSACINGFNLTSFDCAIIVMENGGFTFYWLAGNCFRLSQMPDPESDSVRPTLTNVIIIMKISVFVLIVIAMMIKAFNYLTEWPKFEKNVHRSDSQYIKNSLFEKTILSTVQRSIRRMSNVTLMRPSNGVHRAGVQQLVTFIRWRMWETKYVSDKLEVCDRFGHMVGSF